MAKSRKPKLGSGKRFKQLTEKLREKGATDPGALSAWIGRRKYGNKKMEEMAIKGRKRKDRAIKKK